MDMKSTDLIALFEKALQGEVDTTLQETGVVIKVGDDACRIHGLENVMYGELLDFEGGNKGIVLNLEEDHVFAFLVYAHIPVNELERVKRTGNVFTIPVGNELLGRVVDARGNPVDGLTPLTVTEMRPIERAIPGIAQRSPVNESLETGILAIDALVPIGKGQRELIIGNRSTGKTSLAIDAILHQKNKNVICIYVSIGQRDANVAKIVRTLAEQGSLAYTIVVSATASDSSLENYLAPYVGCTMGEFFRDQQKDVLIIYDDLSNHAIAYREMSLLMRRAPGREAYPGDIFYLHARLLERAGKLITGGSLTALPMVKTQSDDITAYIPTNLISITDGQVFLDSTLFRKGVRPAINVELSISRVGGAAQTKAMKRVTRALRLELAQYHELLGFAQFGTELDPISQQRLARGAIVVELLKQPQFVTYSFVDQVIMLLLLQAKFFDTIELKQVLSFARRFASYVQSVYPELYSEIGETKELRAGVETKLLEIAKEFTKIAGITTT
jgi:F-type H+-transporting ATPase subunit alpha